jgi:sugar/nucleoside kinase (ribokinase family)
VKSDKTGVNKGLLHIAGNAVLDILVRDVADDTSAAADVWSSNVQRLAQPLTAALGGGGAGAAYVAGRFGATVTLNSNLGTDAWGELLQSWLRQANVNLCPLYAEASAAHVITLTPEGRRRSFYYTGSKVDWQRSLDEPTPEWFLASGYGGIDAGDAGSLLHVFRELREHGTKVAFDLSPWFAQCIDRTTMLQLWQQTDCLIGTWEELAYWLLEAGDAQTLAERLTGYGPVMVVVKQGERGAVGVSRDQPGGPVARVNIAVQVVANANSVGAGDTLNGRLLYELCRGQSLATALEQAVATATAVVAKGKGVLGLAVN